ncbi:nucleotidyltransferase family protein [Vibrio sp. TH_r3]|uniref:nucleotidyltransferase domain-containing protein n=1 Tax=Vibrio sp. TH_r3 TaxID=3082084 RepID=UPI002953888D|nr:nucleotidyltransferase family protein [Vibrio sp. TH_r3]MDV7102925.1 nucleotidyltransferase family protein [Vibrio sp. TH_r3]
MTKLIDVLAKPDILLSLTPVMQSDIIAEARYFNMLAQLKAACERCQIWADLPDKLRQHMNAANYTFINQQKQLRYEASVLANIFDALNVKWIYLKGSAYQLAELNEFQGRIMADIDILVSQTALNRVEVALKANGWVHTALNDYDDKYYREKSQEIPPLKHVERQTEIDLHFNILPNTLKKSPDPTELLNQTIDINKEQSGAQILNPQAMVIHSAIHLFHEGEFNKGLRDLYDLFLLFSTFSQQPRFWSELTELQKKLGNGDSVFYALRYCNKLFNMPVPTDIQAFYNRYRPNPINLKVLDVAFQQIFSHHFPPHRRTTHSMVETILYVRGHLKRMPLHMLVPHLIVKSIKSLVEKDDKESDLIF